MNITFQSVNLKEKYHLEDLRVDDGIILKWILKKEDVRVFV